VGLKQRIADITAFVMGLRPVRVFTHYAASRGPLLAAGLSYQAIFAVFAAIWLAFSISGFIIRANPELERALLDLLAANVPGLIDSGDGGAIDPDHLLSAGILGWTGAIAAVGLFFTALGWLASGREAVRTLFRLPGPTTNPFVLKLKDLALALGFGALLIASAALSVFGAAALEWLLDALGIDDGSTPAMVAARVGGLVLVLLLDTVVLGSFYRVVSGIRIPLRLLLPGTLMAAAALGVLKLLGTSLLGGATNNPLLASFAAIIGLLIWFNFVCQVILLGAAWIAVGADDQDVDLNAHRAGPSTPSGTATAL
jgi:membrane protein